CVSVGKQKLRAVNIIAIMLTTHTALGSFHLKTMARVRIVSVVKKHTIEEKVRSWRLVSENIDIYTQ
ncbi:MAG: hypothetical protein QXO48_04875, partial [Desulfurococcaceae archaeon]